MSTECVARAARHSVLIVEYVDYGEFNNEYGVRCTRCKELIPVAWDIEKMAVALGREAKFPPTPETHTCEDLK